MATNQKKIEFPKFIRDKADRLIRLDNQVEELSQRVDEKCDEYDALDASLQDNLEEFVFLQTEGEQDSADDGEVYTEYNLDWNRGVYNGSNLPRIERVYRIKGSPLGSSGWTNRREAEKAARRLMKESDR